MRILIVGGGGREHALAWKLAQSPSCEAIFAAPGNAGTADLGENLAVHDSDIDGICAAAESHRIDLVVVGPEAPLAAGLVDALTERGILAFGPTQQAAQIESSKWFAKQVMQSAGVSHARGELFDSAQAAHKWLEILGPDDLPVLKADGLAAGKGVIVPDHIDDAHDAIDQMFAGAFGSAGERVVIEDRLKGMEASAMAVVSGSDILPLPLSCDYKRIMDRDQGPNTGGMGVYAPPGFVGEPQDVFADVHQPVVEQMDSGGCQFHGLLYAGLMIDDGAMNVLEFNARFGDPETQAILPLLDGDLLPVLEASARGEALPRDAISHSGRASVSVAIVSGGYPGPYETGKPILGLDAIDESVDVFHAGTAIDDDGRTVTAGGRVLAVTAVADTLAEARGIAYDNVRRITFDGSFHRNDIALRELDS
ncbi:MAG: phosphoribosylamine--glycine ligase [Chloroflexi bacterium]|nr:phosphoribosylamine--glycine ligase [Chloroflexota bacterium]MYD15609.1 phosphoribosylamine--glycine ligase [Chloroflexota bacterium]MYJ02610.1 phosphoribosylamine--glycine ligase [Chloroflexota bacterium]